MRLDKHVRDNDLIPKFGMFTLVCRILIRPNVIPGPAIKAAIFYTRNVIWDKIVAKAIAFIDRGPQFASLRMNCNSYRITDTAGVQSITGTIGLIFKDVGPAFLDLGIV